MSCIMSAPQNDKLTNSDVQTHNVATCANVKEPMCLPTFQICQINDDGSTASMSMLLLLSLSPHFFPEIADKCPHGVSERKRTFPRKKKARRRKCNNSIQTHKLMLIKWNHKTPSLSNKNKP